MTSILHGLDPRWNVRQGLTKRLTCLNERPLLAFGTRKAPFRSNLADVDGLNATELSAQASAFPHSHWAEVVGEQRRMSPYAAVCMIAADIEKAQPLDK